VLAYVVGGGIAVAVGAMAWNLWRDAKQVVSTPRRRRPWDDV
jgi:hypothetical protein